MEALNSSARRRILDIVEAARDLTLATIRPDGYPQATTVSYVNDGLTIYAVVGLGSQKAANIQHNSKVSGTINLDYTNWNEIRGISFGATASFVQGVDVMEEIGQKILRKFPEAKQFALESSSPPWPGLLFLRIEPSVISLLDYSVAFGHTELYQVA